MRQLAWYFQGNFRKHWQNRSAGRKYGIFDLFHSSQLFTLPPETTVYSGHGRCYGNRTKKFLQILSSKIILCRQSWKKKIFFSLRCWKGPLFQHATFIFIGIAPRYFPILYPGLFRIKRTFHFRLTRWIVIYPNQIGLAAGFDKRRRWLVYAAVGIWFCSQMGTVTPKPQKEMKNQGYSD